MTGGRRFLSSKSGVFEFSVTPGIESENSVRDDVPKVLAEVRSNQITTASRV